MLALACLLLAGRLWGEDAAPVAASVLPPERVAELVELLEHPIYRKRLTAERVLARRLGAELRSRLEAVQDPGPHLAWRMGLLQAADLEAGRTPDDALWPEGGPRQEAEETLPAFGDLRAEEREPTVRELLEQLQAGRRYSTDAPAFVAMVELGPEARQDFLDTIEDTELSTTLRYYALLAFQRVLGEEELSRDLARVLAQADDYLAGHVGTAFRQSRLDPAPIVELSRHVNPDLRIRAAQAFANMNYSSYGEEAEFAASVREALLAMVADSMHEVGVAALQAMRNHRSRSGEADAVLLEVAARPDVELASAALEALRYTRDQRILPIALEVAQGERHPLLRARALALVGSQANLGGADLSGSGDARELLREAASDPSAAVRIAAYDAMAQARVEGMDELILGRLLELVAEVQRDREPPEQVGLSEQVEPGGEPGETTSGEAKSLEELLESLGLEAGSAAPAQTIPAEQRAELTALARAAGGIAQESALDALIQLLDIEDVSLRTTVLSSLRRLATALASDTASRDRILEAYRGLLGHPDRNTRFYAAQNLANLGIEEVLDDLEPLITDSEQIVRSSVINGLSRMSGSERAAELLCKALETDPEASYRVSAARNLMNINVKSDIVVETLTRAMGDASVEVRAQVAKTMKRLGIEGAEEAQLRELERLCEEAPTYASLVELRQAYREAKRWGDAVRVTEKIIPLAPIGLPRGHEELEGARAASEGGDVERALEFLKAAVEKGLQNPARLRYDHGLRALRENEAFLELVQEGE